MTSQPRSWPVPDALRGELVPLGRLPGASNATLLVAAGDAEDRLWAVYKPVRGMRPLADFDAETLPHREAFAYRVSEALGFACVPPTVLRDGPFGLGSVQLWLGPEGDAVRLPPGPDAEIDVAAVVPEPGGGAVDMFAQTPPDFACIGIVATADDTEAELAHSLSDDVAALACFDVVSDNADRKASHILRGPGGTAVGIDNGLTFAPEEKLRTVLWGFAGRPLTPDIIDALQRGLVTLGNWKSSHDHPGLTDEEICCAIARMEQLITHSVFPNPPSDRYPFPYPLW